MRPDDTQSAAGRVNRILATHVPTPGGSASGGSGSGGSASVGWASVGWGAGAGSAPRPVAAGDGAIEAAALDGDLGFDPPPDRLRRWVSRRAAGVAVLLAVVAVAVAVPRAAMLRDDGGVAPVPGRATGPLGTPSTAAHEVPASPARPSAWAALPSSAPAAMRPSVAAPDELAAASGEVLVHVVGEVRRPGMAHLPAGSRVADAVKAAGGATRKADVAAVNLARPLVDGEQVVVPKPGESVAAAPGSAPEPGGAAGAGSPLDLNTATEAQLDTLPGVGPVIAGRIVAWRQEHGRFTTVDELAEVAGIGEATLEKLRPMVRT